MKDTYGLIGCLRAKEGEVENLAKILLEAADLMKTAEGCFTYLVCRDDEKPNTVIINELWTTKEAHDASLSVPGVRELIGKAMPLLEEMPKGGQELKILGGHFNNL